MTDHLTSGSKPQILGTDCFGQRKLYPDNNPNSWKLNPGDIIFDFHDHSFRLGGPGWYSYLILDRWFFYGIKSFWTPKQYLAHLARNEEANNKKQSV